MKEGDIVLASITQADGKLKHRPTVILRIMPKYGDYLVCGVSSQLRQQIKDFDDLVSLNDSDYATSGLVSPSIIRLGFLALIPKTKVIGAIGSISSQRHRKLLQRLSEYLVKDISRQ